MTTYEKHANAIAVATVERDEARNRILELLDELDAVDVLRQHVVPSRRYLVDRLENAFARIDEAEQELDELEDLAEFEEDAE